MGRSKRTTLSTRTSEFPPADRLGPGLRHRLAVRLARSSPSSTPASTPRIPDLDGEHRGRHVDRSTAQPAQPTRTATARPWPGSSLRGPTMPSGSPASATRASGHARHRPRLGRPSARTATSSRASCGPSITAPTSSTMAVRTPAIRRRLQAAIDYAWATTSSSSPRPGTTGPQPSRSRHRRPRRHRRLEHRDQNDALRVVGNYGADTFLRRPAPDIVTTAAGAGTSSVTGTSAIRGRGVRRGHAAEGQPTRLRQQRRHRRPPRAQRGRGRDLPIKRGRLNLERAIGDDTSATPVQPAGAAPVGGGEAPRPGHMSLARGNGLRVPAASR